MPWVTPKTALTELSFQLVQGPLNFKIYLRRIGDLLGISRQHLDSQDDPDKRLSE